MFGCKGSTFRRARRSVRRAQACGCAGWRTGLKRACEAQVSTRQRACGRAWACAAGARAHGHTDGRHYSPESTIFTRNGEVDLK
ncbi:hypothetical protein CRG98_001144 [Punica granatum]|uniref:Uncharacterized protein n=1 Tax=Punica granatum TaxID=22663 RepID=A0A2I0LCV4_PUNGR|nr:hypothetical protein CRG98_001144 [Punica granatum]